MATDADRATAERLRAILESGSLDELARQQHELAGDDFVQEWPQSGERIRGRDNAKAINDNYPAMTGSTPRFTSRAVVRPFEGRRQRHGKEAKLRANDRHLTD